MKDKVPGFLVDPHGALTIQISEGSIPQVQEGGTYTFKKLTVYDYSSKRIFSAFSHPN